MRRLYATSLSSGARHHDERDIVVLEVRDAAGEAVGDRRAARTAFVPVRPEHEVIDEHLRTPAEQIAQRRIAVFGREPVVVLKRHPGQVTPPSRKLVAAARQFPFSFEQLEARCEPFVASAGPRELRGTTATFSSNIVTIQPSSWSGWCGRAHAGRPTIPRDARPALPRPEARPDGSRPPLSCSTTVGRSRSRSSPGTGSWAKTR